MKNNGTMKGDNQGTISRRIILVLLAATLVPAACILWFAWAAIDNEQLAVRQRLADFYQQRAAEGQGRLEAFWRARQSVPASASQPAARFAWLVSQTLASSVIICDDGRVLYPDNTAAPAEDATDEELPAWKEASQLEFVRAQPLEAAELYEKLARAEVDASRRGQALMARARCLAKVQRRQQAAEVCRALLSEPAFQQARDRQGRLLVPAAQMFLFELLIPLDPAFQSVTTELCHRLNDYSQPMPSSQRLMLMTAMLEMLNNFALQKQPVFPTLSAERLAREYLDNASQLMPQPGVLVPTGRAGVWQLQWKAGSDVYLYEQYHLEQSLLKEIDLEHLPAGLKARICPAGQKDAASLVSLEAPPPMAGWLIEIKAVGQDAIVSAARKRTVAYAAAAGGGITTIACLAFFAVRYVSRQIRLTRLKNDLIATVSHELKTPLASMRVLVDTLLEGRCTSGQQVQDYYQLLSKENLRLSRLIDNFLNFSRMERGKKVFVRQPAEVAEIVSAAAEAVGERFNGPSSKLAIDVEPNLPPLVCDSDAITTVLINLLDNACKYTGCQKQVSLRARRQAEEILLEVEDNGLGLSRRSVRRIFDRFYQVDQSLSRSSGGCGLGLSIVKFIVEAHHGRIEVSSQPGKGSRFTIHLPLVGLDGGGGGHGGR